MQQIQVYVRMLRRQVNNKTGVSFKNLIQMHYNFSAVYSTNNNKWKFNGNNWKFNDNNDFLHTVFQLFWIVFCS